MLSAHTLARLLRGVRDPLVRRWLLLRGTQASSSGGDGGAAGAQRQQRGD